MPSHLRSPPLFLYVYMEYIYIDIFLQISNRCIQKNKTASSGVRTTLFFSFSLFSPRRKRKEKGTEMRYRFSGETQRTVGAANNVLVSCLGVTNWKSSIAYNFMAHIINSRDIKNIKKDN